MARLFHRSREDNGTIVPVKKADPECQFTALHCNTRSGACYRPTVRSINVVGRHRSMQRPVQILSLGISTLKRGGRFQPVAQRRLASLMDSQQSASLPLIVGHDLHNQEFYVKLKEEAGESEQKGVLQYSCPRDGVLDLYHTGVPPEFRGRGIAKVLAKTALDYAVSQDAKVVLTCTYLEKYVTDCDLPQYTSRVIRKP